LALLGAGLSLFAASAAFAQTAAPTAAPAEESVRLDKFVVTGSYIPIAGVATAIPVTVLDSKAIEATGVTSNVMEILRKAAPQFTGNSNLGNTNANISSGATGGGSQVAFRNTQTLVLLNGRRVAYAPILASGGFQYVDVNLFPVGAIERIEILQDGASALYGTDAVSGVVNIILKSDFKGFSADANYSFSDNKGKWASRKFSMVGGTGTDKTAITVGAEWYQQDPMKQYERSFSNPIYGTASFAGIVNIGGQFYVLNPSLNAPPNPGTHLPAATLVANGTYIALASSSNLISGLGSEAQYSFNLADYPTLVLGVQRRSVTLNFDHKWMDNVTVFGDMLYTKTNTFSQLNAQPTTYNASATDVNNPFDVTARARNRFLQNPRQYYYDTDSIRGVIGIKGTFGDGFSWEAAANKNLIGQQYRNEGVVDTITRGIVTANGSINYFARNQAPGAVAASGLFGTALGTANSTLTTYDARLVGKLADLPGGELGFAAGVEYRSETLDQSADRNSQTATFGWDSATTLDPFRKGRGVKSAFAEVRIPVFGGDQKQEFAHLLELTAAGRKEIYSDTDDPLVPKFSFRWLPVDDQLAIRGTYSKSFAAPTLFNLFGPGGVGFTSPLNLTRFGGGPNITGQANARSGANPDLRAARSKSYTFGFVYSPKAIKGFSVTMDYFDIKQTDLISSIGTATILQSVELLGAASPYVSYVRRGTTSGNNAFFTTGTPITAAGQIGNIAIDQVYVSDTLTNIAAVDLSGIDLKVGYTWNSDAFGRFDMSLAGAWYNSYTVQTLPTEDPFETVGLTSNTNGTTPEWQTYTNVSWSRGKWGANLGWSLIPSTQDINGIPAGAGVDSASDDYVETYHAFDVSARYSFGSEWKWLNGLTLRVGAQNVLNEGLPMNKGTDTQHNGDTATFSAVGRLIFVEGKYSF
jgi:iron complex outermembrane receptor protein